MHRLRRALERVSFEQAMGGRLEESDKETHNIPQGVQILTDSSEATHTHMNTKRSKLIQLWYLLGYLVRTGTVKITQCWYIYGVINSPNMHNTLFFSCTTCLFLLDPPDSLLFPASPLDWDGFTDPESLFAADPVGIYWGQVQSFKAITHDTYSHTDYFSIRLCRCHAGQ